jgi:hypothetical protein
MSRKRKVLVKETVTDEASEDDEAASVKETAKVT